MTYETPASLRQALDDRIMNHAREVGIDPQRLRRRVAFERLILRLEHSHPGLWILKGGMALEVRLEHRARATRDVDLAIRDDLPDGTTLREKLITCLSADPEGDGFVFVVGAPTAMSPDEAGRQGWRFSVEAHLAGRQFASIRVDVVARPEEISGTERISIPTMLDFAHFSPFTIEVVDRRQHFAEKLHALTRTYPDRPNTRVRDLADLLLLIHDGLIPDLTLRMAVEHVFSTRNTHDVPVELPDPPPRWRDEYATLAADLELEEQTVDEAMSTLRTFWSQVLDATE